MKCPYCGEFNSRVIDTRKYEHCVIRIRHCESCGKPYKTAEALLDAIKKHAKNNKKD